MESYYSSDEEIAWGPITLREIKGDLKRPWLRPKRRHTLTCNFPMEEFENGASLSQDGTSNNLNVSSTSTEYYTPNESVPNSDNANIVNDTCLNFVKSARELESGYDIANFQQTLVENSYASEDEKEIETGLKRYFDRGSLCDNVKDSPFEKSLVANSSYEDLKVNLMLKEGINEDVILISDEEGSYVMSGNVSLDDSLSKSRLSAGSGTEELLQSSGESNYEENVVCSKDNLYKHTSLPTQGESNSHEVFKEKLTDEIEQSTLIAQVSPMVAKKSWSTSSTPIPDIKLTHFDSSSSKEDSLHLDDTMEEINRLLNQGLNCTMSDEEPISEIPSPKKELTGLQFASSSIVSGSFMQEQLSLFSSTKENITNTPSMIPVLEKRPADQSNLITTPDNNFKIPSIVPRTKTTYPTTPRSCPGHLKNVVSPVALYIKNSPNMVLKQNVRQKELSRIIVPKRDRQNSTKENDPDMPEVVYKPSKKQIVSSEKEIVLPASLRRLNVKEPVIVKHEGRIHQNLNNTNMHRELLENVTDLSIDTTMLDSFGNTSVLTKKHAFIK